MQTAGSGPESPSTDILATLPLTASGHPGNLGLDALAAMLPPLMPRYERESKSYLTIAGSGTGDRHRSVFVAERLAEILGTYGHRVQVRHRELARGNQGGGTS